MSAKAPTTSAALGRTRAPGHVDWRRVRQAPRPMGGVRGFDLMSQFPVISTTYEGRYLVRASPQLAGVPRTGEPETWRSCGRLQAAARPCANFPLKKPPPRRQLSILLLPPASPPAASRRGRLHSRFHVPKPGPPLHGQEGNPTRSTHCRRRRRCQRDAQAIPSFEGFGKIDGAADEKSTGRDGAGRGLIAAADRATNRLLFCAGGQSVPPS